MRGFSAYLPVAALLALAPAAAWAHPHVFIDTGLAAKTDAAGRLLGVEVTWEYDDYYSLLIFEDMGLDADYDGQLTAEELAALQGFDLQWEAGFEGDTYLSLDGSPLALGAPEARQTVVADGRIRSRHFRPLIRPVAAEGVVIQAYDPTYYSAYTVSLGAEAGTGCAADVTPPDLDRAYSLLEELLYAMPADQAEDAYPEVGAAFADTVRLTCAGS